MELGLIIGLGIVAGILLAFSFLVDKEHLLLKLLLSFFVMYLLLLIPKSILDDSDYCEVVVSNSSEYYKYGNNFTGYHWDYDYDPLPASIANEVFIFHRVKTFEYERVCFDNTKTTDLTFYKMLIWIIRLYALYIFLYFNYVVWLKKILGDWKIIPTEKGAKRL